MPQSRAQVGRCPGWPGWPGGYLIGARWSRFAIRMDGVCVGPIMVAIVCVRARHTGRQAPACTGKRVFFGVFWAEWPDSGPFGPNKNI